MKEEERLRAQLEEKVSLRDPNEAKLVPGSIAAAQGHLLEEIKVIRIDRSALNEKANGLADALERTLHNFQACLGNRPVRDVSETIAEAEAALSVWRGGREGGQP